MQLEKHRDQKAGNRCWMDDLELYSILGEAVPADNSVGDKFAMIKNCARFIEQRCTDGAWPTYKHLEERIARLEKALKPFAEMDREDCDLQETACRRGTASDLTILTSGDFRTAKEVLG